MSGVVLQGRRQPLVEPAAAGRQREALQFTAVIMVLSLLLQRFGVPFGSQSLSIVGPLGLAVFGYFLARGALAFDRRRLVIFLAFVTFALLGMVWQATGTAWYSAAQNTNSLYQFLLLTSVATFSFAEPVDETAFFKTVNLCFLVVAIAGLAQFVAQFVGIRIFAFTGLLPDQILFEAGYNLQIPLGVGSLMKSNGFFLVEPSVFSQLMALALLIELLALRRALYIALFAVGLLLSFSGTGWIVIAAFVVAVPFGMGKRGLFLALGVVVLVGALATLVAVLAPDIMAAFQDRFDELSRPGTSGHLRFITPFWLLSDVLSTTPSAAFLGIGSGISERLPLSYEYDVNTPIKIAVEYGFPALLAYVLLFLVGRRTALQGALVVPAVVLFLFTGGYQQFPPMIFIVLLLISTAKLRPSPR